MLDVLHETAVVKHTLLSCICQRSPFVGGGGGVCVNICSCLVTGRVYLEFFSSSDWLV